MLGRRHLLATAGASAVLCRAPGSLFAQDAPTVLRVGTREIVVDGKPARVYGIGGLPPTGYATEQGRIFNVRVENGLAEPTLLHWHGLITPWQQDGVPGVSGPPIPPGGTASFAFPLRQSGTYWMHTHYGLQEQLLLAAPLIIRGPDDRRDEQDVILMLADFSFTPPETIYADLRRKSVLPMAGMAQPATVQPASATASAGTSPAPTLGGGKPDLNDVAYDAFLANDRTLADPEVIRAEPGGRVRLRVLNSASMSNFMLDLGTLQGELIAVDGMAVAPVAGRQFPIAVAQRVDIRLALPQGPGAYPVLAVLEGERKRTGLIIQAGAAPVARIDGMATEAAPALTLGLEANLRALAPLAARKADRVLPMDLTGSMAGYVWTLNGKPYGQDTPMQVRAGERVEMAIVNTTPMPHPMHLHGHTFQVVEIDGVRFPGALRDTILVPPGKRVTIAFDADNPGNWAFHCHLLYHLEAGMFTTLRYV